jgi:hypothetical protein
MALMACACPSPRDDSPIHDRDDRARRLQHAAGADTRQDLRRTPPRLDLAIDGNVAKQSQPNYCTISCTIPHFGG